MASFSQRKLWLLLESKAQISMFVSAEQVDDSS